MDRADLFGDGEALGQPRVLLREARQLGHEWLWWLAPTRLAQRRQGPHLAQASPRHEVRGVEAFAAQEGADLPRLRGRVGLLHDAQLIGGAEPPSDGVGIHFGVGCRRARLAQRGGLMPGLDARCHGGSLPPPTSLIAMTQVSHLILAERAEAPLTPIWR